MCAGVDPLQRPSGCQTRRTAPGGVGGADFFPPRLLPKNGRSRVQATAAPTIRWAVSAPVVLISAAHSALVFLWGALLVHRSDLTSGYDSLSSVQLHHRTTSPDAHSPPTPPNHSGLSAHLKFPIAQRSATRKHWWGGLWVTGLCMLLEPAAAQPLFGSPLMPRPFCWASANVQRYEFGRHGVANLTLGALQSRFRFTAGTSIQANCPGNPYTGTTPSTGPCANVWANCSAPEFGTFAAFYDNARATHGSMYYIVPSIVSGIRIKLRELDPQPGHGGSVRVGVNAHLNSSAGRVVWNGTACTGCPTVVTVSANPGDTVVITEGHVMAVYWVDVFFSTGPSPSVAVDSVAEDCSRTITATPAFLTQQPSYFRCWGESVQFRDYNCICGRCGGFSSSTAIYSCPSGYSSLCSRCNTEFSYSSTCSNVVTRANCDSNRITCISATPTNCAAASPGRYYRANDAFQTTSTPNILGCGLACGSTGSCVTAECWPGYACPGGVGSAGTAFQACPSGTSSPPGSSTCNAIAQNQNLPPSRIVASPTVYGFNLSVYFVPIPADECATAQAALGGLFSTTTRDCTVANCGEYCEGDGECGTWDNNNCDAWDIYRKHCPSVPSTNPTITLEEGQTGFLATLTTIDGNAWPADPCSGWTGYSGGPFNYSIVGGSANAAAFTLITRREPSLACYAAPIFKTEVHALQPPDPVGWPLHTYLLIQSTDPTSLSITLNLTIVTPSVTAAPTAAPTARPSARPSAEPTAAPSTPIPTHEPTATPTTSPTSRPTASPTGAPTGAPTVCSGRGVRGSAGDCVCPTTGGAFNPNCSCVDPALESVDCVPPAEAAADGASGGCGVGCLVGIVIVIIVIVLLVVVVCKRKHASTKEKKREQAVQDTLGSGPRRDTLPMTANPMFSKASSSPPPQHNYEEPVSNPTHAKGDTDEARYAASVPAAIAPQAQQHYQAGQADTLTRKTATVTSMQSVQSMQSMQSGQSGQSGQPQQQQQYGQIGTLKSQQAHTAIYGTIKATLDGRCAYPTRTCKQAAVPPSRFCKAHACPTRTCAEPKGSKEPSCAVCSRSMPYDVYIEVVDQRHRELGIYVTVEEAETAPAGDDYLTVGGDESVAIYASPLALPPAAIPGLDSTRVVVGPHESADVVLSYQAHSTGYNCGNELMWGLTKALRSSPDGGIVAFNTSMLTDPATDRPFAERLREASVFVVMLSRTYLRSDECLNELAQALRLNKAVVAVHLEPVDFTGVSLGGLSDPGKAGDTLSRAVPPLSNGFFHTPTSGGAFNAVHWDRSVETLVATLLPLIRNEVSV